MSDVVVRCTSCTGLSRVGPEAVGAMVVCPRCQAPFVAVEEVAPVAPRPRPAEPVAPPVVAGRPRRSRAEPVAPPANRVVRVGPTDAAHDIGGGLPATVLVGLALLPFLIPLLWVLAPAVAGQGPVLSIAAPTALAIAASALCLAVVYTVDWTPTTRVKGVLMLVGLSYFSAVSLFYLKKEMVDRVKRFFGAGAEWREFKPPRGDFKVLLPGRVTLTNAQPIDGWRLQCHQGAQRTLAGAFVYAAGYAPVDLQLHKADDKWFDDLKAGVLKAAEGGRVRAERPVEHQQSPGREWVIDHPDGVTVRVARVFRVKGRVYALTAEGPHLDPDDDETKAFFASFLVSIPDAKD